MTDIIETNETEFAVLFRKLKKYALIGLLVGALTALIPILFLRLGLPSTLTAERAVDFVFPGAENREYPNGRTFNFNDILTPGVVTQTYNDMGFNNLGVDFSDFRNGLTIEPFAPTYEERAQAFRKKLKLDEITAPEVEIIEQEMKKELSSLVKTSALIRVSFHGDLGVSQKLAEQSISKLLANWASYSITELGVNQLPLAVSNVDLIPEKVGATVDFPLFIELLDDSGTTLTTHLNQIEALKETQTMTVAQGHETLADIARDFQVLKKYRIDPLQKSIVAYGLSNDWPSTRVNTIQTKLELELALEVLQEKAKDLNAGASFYKKLNSGDVLGGVNASKSRAIEEFSISGTQSGSDAFANRVFDIARTNKHQSFLQELVLDQLKVQDSIAQLQTKIQRLEAFIKAADFYESDTDDDRSSIKNRLMASVSAATEKTAIAAELNEMWKRANEILTKSNQSRVANISGLYHFIGEDQASYYYHPVINKRVIILAIVVCFAFSLIFMMFGFGAHLTRSLKTDR